MVALHFYWFCVTVLHLLQDIAGQVSLISVDFIEISPFFNPFRALREPPLDSILLQLYNVDMTFQNNFDTMNFNS